jgi:tetratricopeptide (TPR) repeat protein
LFGVLALSPVLQLLPVGEAMRADRYSYLPAAAWSALPLLWLQRISSRKPRLQPWMRIAPVALLLALLLYQTQRLLPSWQNSETLWRRSISENPLWYAAYNNLGMHYLNVGRVKEAKSMFRKALAQNSDLEGAYINLGFIFNKELNADSASYYLSTGCRKFPSNAIMLNNFAYTLYLQKQYHEALQQVNRSLAIYRDNAYAYRNRAYIYEALQQYALACEDCKHALALNYTAQWGDDVLLLQARVCARAHVP